MVPPARTPLRPDRLRPLNAPVLVEVAVNGDGVPVTIGRTVGRSDGQTDSTLVPSDRPAVHLSVDSILDQWQLDDEWWRQPISRRYVAVMLVGGKRMLIFEDLVTGEWFEQTP